jgi:small-conductance mechanosensitive channel
VRIKVGVAYGSDTRLVRDTLLDAARAHDDVLESPAPEVFFRDFGDSSLDFGLAFWVDSPADEPRITSEVRFAIDDAFRARGIAIPFPQRDLHVKSGTLAA